MEEKEESDNSRRPRGRIYYYDRQLLAAFKKDCEDLFDEYEKLNTLSFDEFANLWREKNYSFIFAGQNCALLLKEFLDDCFYSLKKYMVFPRSLNTQAAALYMLYGIYYKQPLRNWVKIRMTMEEFQKLLEFVQEMGNQDQLDVVFIFRKMLRDQVFLFVATRRPLGPEDRFVKKYEFYYNDTFASANTTTSLNKFKKIDSCDILEELEVTNNEYEKLLNKYSGKCQGLELAPSTIISDIRDALAEFSISSYQKPEPDKDHTGQIKKRAMRNKNAVYRASKKVKTAVDLDEDVDDPLAIKEDEPVEEKVQKQKKPGSSMKGSFMSRFNTVKKVAVKKETVKKGKG
ncbi:unnamed protein product [Acanthoscelides obtectus]|uniref:snRNA-activating protein complex subunit 1 n=1 Tax=Acanthoscelides obtectus TaxID=200917 RepID=A0A9P0LZV7_ACAOB|nr:unnamed protein product [Acanthoscelides obtectus]CAK1664635.1 snRNA-activating protein complex subunit 1 [Acanthoscelides obtectus]